MAKQPKLQAPRSWRPFDVAPSVPCLANSLKQNATLCVFRCVFRWPATATRGLQLRPELGG